MESLHVGIVPAASGVKVSSAILLGGVVKPTLACMDWRNQCFVASSAILIVLLGYGRALTEIGKVPVVLR